MKLENTPAFVLHSRHYGETSLIIDCLTRDFGRLSLYARGARQRRKTGRRFDLAPFTPLTLSAQGKGTLKSLTSAEAVAAPFALAGRPLFCGLYLNELLCRLLPEFDVQPDIFSRYMRLLADLSQCEEGAGDAEIEVALRHFEWQLVCTLGVGFSLQVCADTGVAVSAQGFYLYRPGVGLVEAPLSAETISGDALISFSSGQASEPGQRRQLKLFMRRVLAPLLGGKPLAARALFR